MTIILEGDGRATIDRRPVMVAVTGIPPHLFELAVMDGSTELTRGVVRRRAGVIVLPRVERALAIRLLPEHADEFAAGSVLAVRITTEATPESAGDDVLVQAVDVSGLRRRDVVVLDVLDATRLSVTANKVIRDEPLSPLGNAARAATRAHLRDATPEPVNVLVAVDTSASMAWPLTWRSVEAVIDVVAGMSQVVGQGRELAACLLTGDDPIWLPPSGARDLAADTRSAIERAGRGCGFRSTPRGLPARTPAVSYVVTDAVPADIGALRRASRPDDVRHLVLLADGGEPPPPEAHGLPVTRLGPPEPNTDTPSLLLGSPPRLAALVGSLLAGVRT